MKTTSEYDSIKSSTHRFFEDYSLRSSDISPKKPITNVYTKGGNLIIKSYLPNFRRDHIKIQVDENNNLVIVAKKNDELPNKYRRAARSKNSSVFYRSVTLPERVDASQIQADFNGDILTVTIRLTATKDPDQITINYAK